MHGRLFFVAPALPSQHATDTSCGLREIVALRSQTEGRPARGGNDRPSQRFRFESGAFRVGVDRQDDRLDDTHVDYPHRNVEQRAVVGI
jgi:hypothetical protein